MAECAEIVQQVSTDDLLVLLGKETDTILERNVDVHIRSLRRKMGEDADLIITVRGVGYKLCVPASA